MRQVKTREVNEATKPGLAEETAGALDWWRDAGVDCDFHEDAQQWLASGEVKAAPVTEVVPASLASPASTVIEPPPAPAIDRAALPQALAEFAAWWTSEPWLDAGPLTARIPPRGSAHAELMILVPEPEREDSDRLLSGPQGRLLNAILAAMGLAPETAYLASALPRHTPHADWSAARGHGLGEVLRHHVKLAAPKRLIVLGNNILPLLGHDPANNAAPYSEYYHDGLQVPLLAGRELAALLERPRWKAGFWNDWLAWQVGETG